MPYTEPIGVVVGKDGADGRTYKPEVIKTDTGFQLIFKTEDDTITSNDILLPFFKPSVNNNVLTFEYVSDVNNMTMESYSYDLYEHLRGPAGSIGIDTVEINTKNLTINNNGDFVTEGKFFPDVGEEENEQFQYIHILQSIDEPGESLSGDAYVAKFQDGVTKWTRISDFIDISKYTKQSDFNSFKNDVDAKMQCILAEQREIQEILRSGRDIEIEPATDIDTSNFKLNLNTVQVEWTEEDGTKVDPITMYQFIQNIKNTIYFDDDD